mgnify:CR=1 FL=1
MEMNAALIKKYFPEITEQQEAQFDQLLRSASRAPYGNETDDLLSHVFKSSSDQGRSLYELLTDAQGNPIKDAANQFQFDLGISWLSFMKFVVSPINKCIKIPLNG